MKEEKLKKTVKKTFGPNWFHTEAESWKKKHAKLWQKQTMTGTRNNKNKNKQFTC